MINKPSKSPVFKSGLPGKVDLISSSLFICSVFLLTSIHIFRDFAPFTRDTRNRPEARAVTIKLGTFGSRIQDYNKYSKFIKFSILSI